MIKRKAVLTIISVVISACMLTACSVVMTDKQIEELVAQSEEKVSISVQQTKQPKNAEDISEETVIELSDDGILVDGAAISNNVSSRVYAANDIVFYLAGQDFTYGEGEARDEHSQQEADEYTVVHIGEPGTYYLSGNLSKGQIAVDLGDEAIDDRNSVVNLVLDNADITCNIAPAIIFYNVYECGESTENPVDTDIFDAGANIIIADGSENNIKGSHVSKIYKSYELNDKGTKVKESEKLHKYDGAVFSKMSMNIAGGDEGTGILNVSAENEGIGSDRHLAFNGGTINVLAGNDAVNASCNDQSVIIINDGTVNAVSDGSYVGGDGIDSNGWIVVNGGTVNAQASSDDENTGLDSSKEIVFNGGTVNATGNIIENISSESTQDYVIFEFREKQNPRDVYSLVNEEGFEILSFSPKNSFDYMLMSAGNLQEGLYSLFYGGNLLNIFEENSGEEDQEETECIAEDEADDAVQEDNTVNEMSDNEILPDNTMPRKLTEERVDSEKNDNSIEESSELVVGSSDNSDKSSKKHPVKNSKEENEKKSNFRLVKGFNYVVISQD